MSKTRQQIADLLKEGKWHIVRNTGGHAIYRCACGNHQISVPTSPSDHRALANFKSDLRRCPTSRNIFDGKRPKKETVADTDDIIKAVTGHTMQERTQVTTPIEPIPDLTEDEIIAFTEAINDPPKRRADIKVPGLTGIVEETIVANFDGVFTTNMVTKHEDVAEYFDQAGVDSDKERRVYVQRSIRNVVKRGVITQLNTRRDGESEFRKAGKTIADHTDAPTEPWEKARGIAENPAAPPAEDLIAEAHGRTVARSKSDIATFSVGDVLEILALVGDLPLVRDTTGQIYALRPVRLEVL